MGRVCKMQLMQGKKSSSSIYGEGLKKKKAVECDLCFLPPSRPLFSPLLWAENGSAPLQQVLGPANWERMGSGAAVPARAPAGAVPLTPAKPGEELLQPSCWEGWARGRQHFPNSANISSEREGGLACGAGFSCAPPAAGGGLAVPLRWPRDAWTVGVRLCGRWSGHVVATGLGLSAEKPLGKEGRSCVES